MKRGEMYLRKTNTGEQTTDQKWKKDLQEQIENVKQGQEIIITEDLSRRTERRENVKTYDTSNENGE